jgi:hypothetical protein
MVSGNRELIAGLVRTNSFGPCVMLGLGGILTEAVADVAFRLAHASTRDDASTPRQDLVPAALCSLSFGARPWTASLSLMALSRIAEDRRCCRIA